MAQNTKLKQSLLDTAIDVIIVLVLVLGIRAFLFAPFRINGPSMCDTFNVYNGECFHQDGEYVLTSRLSIWDVFGWSPTEIDRGDIVVFQNPYGRDGEYFIKRVVGVPGDNIKIEAGLVYMMNEVGEWVELDEPYLNEENQGNTELHRKDSEEYLVPEDSYFVMGDNRVKSNDSRRCFRQLGCNELFSPYLDSVFIEGEVRLVLFPVSHFRWVSGYEYQALY